MGIEKEDKLNGDAKVIFGAISKLQIILSALEAKSEERHEANLRTLENMSGDVHIVLSKVQELPCGKHQERMNGMGTNIKWMWGVISGVGLIVVAAFVNSLAG